VKTPKQPPLKASLYVLSLWLSKIKAVSVPSGLLKTAAGGTTPAEITIQAVQKYSWQLDTRKAGR
jgi:hypothetical protein